MFERFDFAFAMRRQSERGLPAPDGLILAHDIPLASDLRVSSLSAEDRASIRTAGNFRHKGLDARVIHEPLYAVIRDIQSNDAIEDTKGRLELALALSRLVTPSMLGLDLWGQAARGMTEELRTIEIHYGPSALKSKGERWWHTPDDWQQVRTLLAHLDGRNGPASWHRLDGALPESVRNAIQLVGKAAFHDTAHLRHLLLVPSLEGMVVQCNEGVARTFRERLVKICDDIKHVITPDDLDEIYANRCSVAHIGLFRSDPDEHVVPYYQKLDRMMSAILQRAIDEPEFGAAFKSYETLQGRWPVPVLTKCKAWTDEENNREDLNSCLRAKLEKQRAKK